MYVCSLEKPPKMQSEYLSNIRKKQILNAKYWTIQIHGKSNQWFAPNDKSMCEEWRWCSDLIVKKEKRKKREWWCCSDIQGFWKERQARAGPNERVWKTRKDTVGPRLAGHWWKDTGRTYRHRIASDKDGRRWPDNYRQRPKRRSKEGRGNRQNGLYRGSRTGWTQNYVQTKRKRKRKRKKKQQPQRKKMNREIEEEVAENKKKQRKRREEREKKRRWTPRRTK